MRHLIIGQRKKAPNFSAFHWSPRGCLITISQHFVTTRVVHLPKRTETSIITESDQSRANHQLLQLCTVRTAWSDSDQAVRAVHSCKSWLLRHDAVVSGCLTIMHKLESSAFETKPFIDGWMTCVLFYSISIISGQWAGDNEMLCAMEPRLRLKRYLSQMGLEPGTARSTGHRLSYRVSLLFMNIVKVVDRHSALWNSSVRPVCHLMIFRHFIPIRHIM